MEYIELDEFIRDALVRIKKGVQAANADLRKDTSEQRPQFRIQTGSGKESLITFDVAVTASKKDKAGIVVIALGMLGGKVSTANMNERISRISFTVTPFQIDIA